MSSIVLSIHHEYCESIYRGEKLFEFRKIFPSKSVDTVFFCETHSGGKVTGFGTVRGLYRGDISEVWAVTSSRSGIDSGFYYKYYSGKSSANVVCMGDVRRFDQPICVCDFGVSRAPQSFAYVNGARFELLQKANAVPTVCSPYRLFVCGAPGVGKTTFASRVAGQMGYAAYSSSVLTRQCVALTEERKVVSSTSACDYRDELLSSLRDTSWFTDGGLLEGQFVLINVQGERQLIPIESFSALSITGVLALYCDSDDLVRRYVQQPRRYVDPRRVDLPAIQEAELARAHEVATALGLPIEELKV